MTQRKSKPSANGHKIEADKATKADAFDIWLNRGLHQLYDNIAQEPVPPELLRLIEEDRSK